MNAIDFIRESAAFIAKDRDDVYDMELAVADVSNAIETLRNGGDDYPSIVMFTSYVMSRIVDDGVEEFILSRKLSSLLFFEDEEVCDTYAHTPEINLPDLLDEDFGL